MKARDILEEKVSVDKLETSPRIDKTPMIGWYAVVQGNKIWKSNIASVEEAKDVIKAYDATLPDHPLLKIVFVTK